MEENKEGQKNQDKKANRTALYLGIFVLTMLGMAYAAVPLYEIFCQVTGFGGTTQRAESGSEIILDRKIKIQFDANIANDLPWEFKPVQREVEVKIGETKLVFYHAKNFANENIKGTAVFNVTPDVAGEYFNKIECFCFTEQLLNAKQETDMPIEFFIDPEYANDPDLEFVNTVTLSYTFYPVKE